MTGLTRTLNFDGTWAKKGLSHVSVKRGQVCFAESRLELDAFLLAEFDDEIVNFKPQPISFTLTINRKKRRYTPDVLLQHATRGYFLKEVKQDEAAEQSRFIEDFEFKKWHAKRHWNIELSLLKESEIRVGSTIDNYKRLYYYRRYSLPGAISKRKLINRLGKTFTFCDLKNAVSKLSDDKALPYECIAWGQCQFDVTHLLNDNTQLEVH